MERRRILGPRARSIAAKLMAAALVPGLVLVAWLGFGASWAFIGVIPHVAMVVIHVIRRVTGGEQPVRREFTVDMSPHSVHVRAEAALHEIGTIRELELVGGENIRARARRYVVTVESRPAGAATAVTVECRPRLLGQSTRKSEKLVRRIVTAIAPAASVSPRPRRTGWLDRLLEDPQ